MSTVGAVEKRWRHTVFLAILVAATASLAGQAVARAGLAFFTSSSPRLLRVLPVSRRGG